VAEHSEKTSLLDFLMEELYFLRGGGLGAGGRHHTPFAGALSAPKVNFGDGPTSQFC
jgi:hypothetical protein